MFIKQLKLSHAWLLAIVLGTLTLAGCSDDDKRGIVLQDKAGSGEMFHGAEWATIKNLDPRGEQCIDCHGKSADLSPNGGKGHNIGLKNNTDHSAYADLKITGVKVNETSGAVTVTLNKAIPAGAGALSMTFAKLAPRVIHNRGHDWQNYFSSNATGRGGNEPKASFMPNGGVQPLAVPNPQVNGKTITFNLNTGEGRSFGKHDFTVKSAYENDTETWEYKDVLGTKMKMGADLASHVYCDAAHADSNQTKDKDGDKAVCWWPDGTHLTAGTFVTTENEFVVEYNPDQTHRVTLILGSSAGNPGFNAWYDFVPSVANGDKTPADFTADGTTLTGTDYIKNNGEINALDYSLAEGNRAPGGTTNNATHGHQDLPAARDVVDVQSCNSCHDGLTMHGGSGRSQTQVCVTCHNPGNLQASSGRSVDFKQLIHRIHRGQNLPSEDPTIAALMNGNSLVADNATDFTKVRFPQGPTPGNAAGITNCVKCHMGEQTQGMVQGLADTLGADNFDVQSKMKLAKVTPQGDNWLSVRSVNACQACHDSNVWFANGNSVGTNAVNNKRNEAGTTNPTDQLSANLLDKYMPFYTEKYSGIGYEWLGKKLTGTATGGGGPKDAGWVHNTNTPGADNRFTCGSGGGCHGNDAINDLTASQFGDRSQIAIQRIHLRLTRDLILAERFSINISNTKVAKNTSGKYEFTADVQLLDNQTNTPVTVSKNTTTELFEADITDVAFASYKTLGPVLGPRNLFTGYMGWMNDSPDYNHSLGHAGDDFTEIPGGAMDAPITWTDGSSTGKIVIALETLPNNQWASIKDQLSKVVGTLVVRGSLGDFPATLNLKAATADFRFDNSAVNDDGRRQVVDFLAGEGNDANRNRYASWDKEHGSNTQSCSSCHLQLAMHAGVTNNVQACVLCHNPQRTDLNSRTKRGTDLAANNMVKLGVDGQFEESLDLKRLIHGIHSAGAKFRKDTFTAYGLAIETFGKDKGNSFPGKLSNCKSCHIQSTQNGQWTFELTQLPKGMIGSTAITADWSKVPFKIEGGPQHDLSNHLKMSPIASVCSSCHDAGYKTSEGRMNANILDGGPYVGSHWWVMGGIAPGIVPDNGAKPSDTKHQSGL